MEKAPKISAGLVMFDVEGGLRVFLVHPGGPYWEGKDDNCWSIPKGEIESVNVLSTKGLLLQDAIREYEEETGLVAVGPYIDLGFVTQKSGKIVYAWAFKGKWDGAPIKSNSFKMEWPKGSGIEQEFPECDRASFFSVSDAKVKINPAQYEIILRLEKAINKRNGEIL